MTSVEAMEYEERLQEQNKDQGERFAGFESQGGSTIYIQGYDQASAIPRPPPQRPLIIEDPVEASLAFESDPTPSPPPSTAPPAVESRKRARKHTTAYREAFGDSQEDPQAGIKRGKAGGLV
jgi:hypothetical protein